MIRIGDTLLDLSHGKWRRSSELQASVPLIAVRRKGVRLDDIDFSKFKAGIKVFDIPGLEAVSSSEVRQRIIDGQPIQHLVDEKVAEYIRFHHLYEGKLSL